MTDPTSTHRFHPTPAWLIYGLLVVEGLLWLSERYRWFSFNEKKGWAVLIAVAVVGVATVVMLLWFVASLLFRWRFQFSIRSLLVLVVAVAVPCSWLAVRMKKAREQKEAVAAVTKLTGNAYYDYECDASGYPGLPRPPESAWLRSLLGNDFFAEVACVVVVGHQVTDADLEHLDALNQLLRFDLLNTTVTDAGLENLRRLNRLQVLDLTGTHVTDEGVKKLQHALPNCKIER